MNSHNKLSKILKIDVSLELYTQIRTFHLVIINKRHFQNSSFNIFIPIFKLNTDIHGLHIHDNC